MWIEFPEATNVGGDPRVVENGVSTYLVIAVDSDGW